MKGINQRQSITPCNYHLYEVAMPLGVVGGPIRPWFGQPGLKSQFYIRGKGEILVLLDIGFLRRVRNYILHAGGGYM